MITILVVLCVAQWIVLLVLGVTQISLLRNMAVLTERVQQMGTYAPEPLKIAVGSLLPFLPLHQLDGAPVEHGQADATPMAFTLISPSCGPCHDMLRQLAMNGVNSEVIAPATNLTLISIGDTDATTQMLHDTGLLGNIPVLIADRDALNAAWGIVPTPTTISAMLHTIHQRAIQHKINLRRL